MFNRSPTGSALVGADGPCPALRLALAWKNIA